MHDRRHPNRRSSRIPARRRSPSPQAPLRRHPPRKHPPQRRTGPHHKGHHTLPTRRSTPRQPPARCQARIPAHTIRSPPAPIPDHAIPHMESEQQAGLPHGAQHHGSPRRLCADRGAQAHRRRGDLRHRRRYGAAAPCLLRHRHGRLLGRARGAPDDGHGRLRPKRARGPARTWLRAGGLSQRRRHGEGPEGLPVLRSRQLYAIQAVARGQIQRIQQQIPPTMRSSCCPN